MIVNYRAMERLIVENTELRAEVARLKARLDAQGDHTVYLCPFKLAGPDDAAGMYPDARPGDVIREVNRSGREWVLRDGGTWEILAGDGINGAQDVLT